MRQPFSAPARVRIVATLALIVFGVSTAAALPTYTCERLHTKAGFLGGRTEAINAHGAIVGEAYPESGKRTAYRWGKNLGGKPIDQSRGQSEAHGMNDSGQAVGLNVKGDSIRAMLWDDGAEFKLDGLAGPHGDASALGINNAGQIVGLSEVPGRLGWHATLWDHGSIVDLVGTDDVEDSGAGHINDDGLIVGYRGLQAASWDHGAMTDLGVLPGGERASASASNRRGVIVGRSHFPGGDPWLSHAIAWHDGVITDLGYLPGGQGSYANAVNDAGTIVGTSEAFQANLTAVVWFDLSPNPVDLNALVADGGCKAEDGSPVKLEWATGINRHGQIAAHGAGQGFRLTPQ